MSHVNRYVPVLALESIKKHWKDNPPKFRCEMDEYFVLLDLFYRLKVFNKNIKYTDEGMIRISCKYFKSIITNNYASYLRWLTSNKIILCDRIKSEGRAYGYKLNPELESKLEKVSIPKEKTVATRIITNYNRKQNVHHRLDDHFKIMKKHFKKCLQIDSNAALLWLEKQLSEKTINLTKYNVYYLSVKLIEDKEFYFKINEVNNRLDSNLTNLKSELRQFIKGDLIHIDCKNSQPLIINFILDYILINKENLKTTIPPSPSSLPSSLGVNHEKILLKQLDDKDLEYLKFFPKLTTKQAAEFTEFRKDTFSGEFYNLIQKRFEVTENREFTREEIKNILYIVFFSKNGAYRKEKKVFKALYPTIYQIIYQLKKKRHNKFALCLQNIESEIFIKRISKKLVEEGVIPLTIHDSVVVLSKDVDQSLKVVGEVYEEMLMEIPKFSCAPL